MEYITVKQYAKIKNISQQAVYKQLNNKLKGFVVVENGKKYISINALTETELKEFNNQIQPNSTKVVKPLNEIEQPNSTTTADETATIQRLLAQVETLQKKNDELTTALLELSAKNVELTEKLTDLLRNSQVLLANEKKLCIEEPEQTRKRKGFLGLFKKV